MSGAIEKAIVEGAAVAVASEAFDLLKDHDAQNIDKSTLYLQNIMMTLHKLSEHWMSTPECPDMEYVVTLHQGQAWQAHRNDRAHLCMLVTVPLDILIQVPLIGSWPMHLNPGWNTIDPPDQSMITITPTSTILQQNVLVYLGAIELNVQTDVAGSDPTRPAEDAFAVTPNDSADLASVTRGIAFSTAGDIHVMTADGSDRTIPSGVLASGIVHAIQIRRIYATGTTATGIWAFI